MKRCVQAFSNYVIEPSIYVVLVDEVNARFRRLLMKTIQESEKHAYQIFNDEELINSVAEVVPHDSNES